MDKAPAKSNFWYDFVEDHTILDNVSHIVAVERNMPDTGGWRVTIILKIQATGKAHVVTGSTGDMSRVSLESGKTMVSARLRTLEGKLIRSVFGPSAT